MKVSPYGKEADPSPAEPLKHAESRFNSNMFFVQQNHCQTVTWFDFTTPDHAVNYVTDFNRECFSDLAALALVQLMWTQLSQQLYISLEAQQHTDGSERVACYPQHNTIWSIISFTRAHQATPFNMANHLDVCLTFYE